MGYWRTTAAYRRTTAAYRCNDRAGGPCEPADRQGEIAHVQLDAIGFHYGQQKILHQVSLQVRKGDFLGIQGGSGKGKTTLFKILLGVAGQEKGEVMINGIVTGQQDRRKYWNKIAYVKQQPFIIHDTVLVNITLQEHSYDEERLTSAIALSGLDELIKKLPGRAERQSIGER